MSTTASSAAHGSPHLLLFPFPAPGHIIPIIDFAGKLLSRGLTITILIPPKDKSLLHPLISAYPSSIHPLLLSPATPPPPILAGIIRSTTQLRNPIIQWFQSHASPPIAIVSDFYLGWTHNLASQLSIPRVVFSPSGSFALSVSYSLWHDLPENGDPNNDENFPVTFNIPNSPVYPWWQLHNVYRKCLNDRTEMEFMRENMLANTLSWGAVFNSFTELERVYFDHIKKTMGHDRVWAVGPLLPPEDEDLSGSNTRGGSSSKAHEVMTWLDACVDHSVVYVCFGSRAVLTCAQMAVLAGALEASGVHFILCVRDAGHVAGVHGVLPDGFEERVGKRVVVVRGWAPQVAILRHRAVGVFLSHCGWNSVLEGLTSGVVMLTWPNATDQFTNVKLLVEELGVAKRACEGGEKVPDRDELTQLLAESVGGNSVVRVRSLKLRDVAMKAIKSGGESDRSLDEFVKRVGEQGSP